LIVSLYEDLGVSPEADAAAIKAAHRKAAKEHHPDAGGDREKFELVQKAWLVLSDTDARKRYDETGQTETPRNDRAAVVASILTSAFTNAVREAKGEFDHADLINMTRLAIKAEKLRQEREITNAEKDKATVEKLLERLAFKGDGADPIGQMLRQQISEVNRFVAAGFEKVAAYDEAVARCDDWDFSFTPRYQEDPATARVWSDVTSFNTIRIMT
jgi:curved DNA-binding protein CbpA